MKDNWIHITDNLPINDENVLCWICKFGDIKRGGQHPMILYYDNIDKIWKDEYSDFENNPDFMEVVYWQYINPPLLCQI